MRLLSSSQIGINHNLTQAASERERPAERRCIGRDAELTYSDGSRKGKLISLARRRVCIDHVRCQFNVSECRACRVLGGQHSSTQQNVPKGCADEDRLVADMIELAMQSGRFGQRRIAALLRDAARTLPPTAQSPPRRRPRTAPASTAMTATRAELTDQVRAWATAPPACIVRLLHLRRLTMAVVSRSPKRGGHARQTETYFEIAMTLDAASAGAVARAQASIKSRRLSKRSERA